LKQNRLSISYLILFSLATVLLVAWLAVARDPYAGKLATYLPFHMLAETVSIVIAIMIFGVMWNAYSSERPGGLVVLSCAMVAAGIIDFGHMLSVSDMPDFVTPSGPEKGIAFWLVARMVVALGFAAAAWYGHAPLRAPRSRYLLLGAFLGITALTYWLVLFYIDVLPHTFEAGKGLTAVKIDAEYLVIAVLIVAVIVLYRRARRTQTAMNVGLFEAASVAVLCEMYFAIYASAHDLFQVLGHAYKIIAYLLLWRAVFVVTVRDPFTRLKELSRSMVATLESRVDERTAELAAANLSLRESQETSRKLLKNAESARTALE